MERFDDIPGMLDLISRPAFAVSCGMITHLNSAAKGCMLQIGQPVEALLHTGAEEYAEQRSGCLYLTLSVEERIFGATAVKLKDKDVFVLDQEAVQPELQALALAARELRGPLSSMIYAVNRLNASGSHKDAESAHQAAILNRNIQRLLRLVSNMSDAYRYTVEPLPRQELRDLSAVLDEIFEKAVSLTAQTGIRVSFTNQVSNVIGLVDTDRLERAVFNILSNAMKFTGADGTVNAKLTRRGDKLCLTVSDSGTGIPQDILSTVFSRYLRQPCAENGLYGLGLGMVLIRSTAAAHGGTVLIEQTRGKGTRLTLTLAIRQIQDGELASTRLKIDYAGEMDHCLLELSDVLPDSLYQ